MLIKKTVVTEHFKAIIELQSSGILHGKLDDNPETVGIIIDNAMSSLSNSLKTLETQLLMEKKK